MLPPEVNIWAQDMAGIVQSAVTAEAAQVFGENAQVACIVSIGTGHSAIAGHVGSDASRKRLPYILTKNIERMAADSEKAAVEMNERYRNVPGIYHRLDVNRGLQSISLDEWKRLGEVRGHTQDYMRLDNINQRINEVVNALTGSSSYQTYKAGQLCGH
jgi:hypothetical protein